LLLCLSVLLQHVVELLHLRAGINRLTVITVSEQGRIGRSHGERLDLRVRRGKGPCLLADGRLLALRHGVPGGRMDNVNRLLGVSR
jgi:hypothetical protein